MMAPSIIEKCKRPRACNSVTQKHELMRQIKSSGELVRFSNQLRFRHTFADAKDARKLLAREVSLDSQNITSFGGYDV
ncbi:TPA: hypothetical protein ACGSSZ_001337 [Vibrio parahaemolyticus]